MNDFLFSPACHYIIIMCVQSQSPDAMVLHDLKANSYQKGEGLFVCIPSCDYMELKSGVYK